MSGLRVIRVTVLRLDAPYGVGVSWLENLIELETDGGES